MQKYFIKLLPFVAALLFATKSFAGDCGCEPCKPACECEPCKPACEPCKPACECEPCKPACDCCCPAPDTTPPVCGFSCSARVNVECSWDVFASASFIYWEPREKGLELATVMPVHHVIDSVVQSGSIVRMPFEYKPGFKVGLGMNFCHDSWVFDVDYTRLHGKHGTHYVAADTDELLPSWYPMSTTNVAYETSGHWQFKSDMIDFQLSRPFYLGCKLTVNPFFGGRWGWLRQSLSADYLGTRGGTDWVSSHHRDKTWLVGPRIGLDTRWVFGDGFRLFGNAAGCLAYQHHKISNRYGIWAPDTADTAVNLSETIGLITPNAEMGIGLGWGTYFACNGWYLDISAEWDHQVFFNQNMMRSLVGKQVTFGTNTVDSDAGDLSLQGVTVTLRLDF